MPMPRRRHRWAARSRSATPSATWCAASARPSNVSLSNDAAGRRVAVVTWTTGPRAGIYTFTAGRLSAIEGNPDPQPVPRAGEAEEEAGVGGSISPPIGRGAAAFTGSARCPTLLISSAHFGVSVRICSANSLGVRVTVSMPRAANFCRAAGRCHRLLGFIVQLRDDSWRRSSRRHQAEPGGRLEAAKPELIQRRDIRRRR